jgi:hypothetical protein
MERLASILNHIPSENQDQYRFLRDTAQRWVEQQRIETAGDQPS